MKVLVVEDDEIILEGLRYSLEQEGYEVLPAADATQAMEILRTDVMLDFCLLDVMLPDGSGFAICDRIRQDRDVPILFLTACDDEASTVRALELGADDYIAKPFRIRELLARMKAILRRTGTDRRASADNIAWVGNNKIDIRLAKVYRNGEEIILTAMEYKLLLVFLQHRGQILTRTQILDQLWDAAGDFVNDNTLTVYIKRLRDKLGDMAENQMIQTVRGVGYRLER